MALSASIILEIFPVFSEGMFLAFTAPECSPPHYDGERMLGAHDRRRESQALAHFSWGVGRSEGGQESDHLLALTLTPYQTLLCDCLNPVPTSAPESYCRSSETGKVSPRRK